MTELFGIPTGTLATALAVIARRRTLRRRRPGLTQSHLLQARRTEHPAPSRPYGPHRRGSHARHDDHRGRARHRRHDELDHPLLRVHLTWRHGRARIRQGNRGRVDPDRRVTQYRLLRRGGVRARPQRGGGLSPRGRRRAGDLRDGRGTGPDQPAERAANNPLRERSGGARGVRPDLERRRHRVARRARARRSLRDRSCSR